MFCVKGFKISKVLGVLKDEKHGRRSAKAFVYDAG
jgi:hypothetical protein